MLFQKLSRKQKKCLLGLGCIVILLLFFFGEMKKEKEMESEQSLIANEELLILGTAETVEGLEANEIYTDKGIYLLEKEIDCTPYLFHSVQAVTEEQQILQIKNLFQREVKLENCLIVENKSDDITIFSQGYRISLPCKNLSVQFSDEIADIYIANGRVIKISTKGERISGKILSIRLDGIELQGYGVVPVSEKFRFYETYGAYEEKTAYGLVVGYEQVDLVVAEGKICAAVLKRPLSIENIRVMIKTTDFVDLLHHNVILKAHGNYQVTGGEEPIVLTDGQMIELNSTTEIMKAERVIFTPQSEDARMEIGSIRRNQGTPLYAGTIEVVKDSGGLLIINEVDLETYLYGVVPSEMPADYELEALKAQAVCARSYAYRQILLNGYANYGAHVDDSVSYQVYNNLPTNEKVMQAVNETAGKVLKFGDEVATTYYFSTSCGYTTNETIWKNGMLENRYISGKLLNDSKKKLDLTNEEVFRDFLLNEKDITYDSGESWYRWELTIPVKQITENVCSVENIGTVKEIRVIKRNEGGVVQKVLVTGEKGNIELEYEHAIRTVLNGKGQKILRKYGKETEGGNMLPSGFFVVDKMESEGKLTGFRFTGGGFGHGAGMSQNGANHMAEEGKTYEEILNLFYEGTMVSEI